MTEGEGTLFTRHLEPGRAADRPRCLDDLDLDGNFGS